MRRCLICISLLVLLPGCVSLVAACSGGSGGNASGAANGASTGNESHAPTSSVADRPPVGNSAWIYDTLYRDGHRHGRQPGGFASALNAYNNQAKPGRAITRVFIYGGSLEMYCPHKAASCRLQDLNVTYGREARHSVTAYSQRVAPADDRSVIVAPVLDGRIDANYPGSLKGFNKLSPKMARQFADKVARRICADPNADGVQFDVEPFNVERKNGQYWFYRRIASDFAGSVGASGHDPFHCVDPDHPHGRYFSIFAAAHHMSADSPSGQHVRSILLAHHNGFLVAPLYGLGQRPSGDLDPISHYAKQAENQVRIAVRGASALGVPFQIAVPAAASTQEYARCRGRKCGHAGAAAHTQLDYLRAAVSAIHTQGAADSKLYLGTAIWTWSRFIGRHDRRVSPTQPTPQELHYLQQHM